MKQIGNYRVEDIPLGSGGMGQVLKGYDVYNRPVAIKEILPTFVTDIEYKTRIDREIQFLRQLNSSNVVKIYDSFSLAGNLYIVMELVEGENIEQMIERVGALPLEQCIDYMVKILKAIQYIHESNIVHRDIKPSNIMIRPNNDICLLDFGVAKDMSGSGGTQFGTVIGTDGYMSPEQANGMSIDHRSDIYSLGCVFYYMLTGHHAYNKLASDVETQLAIVSQPFPRINKYVAQVPDAIQTIMDYATDKNMMRRYQSCREFCYALENLNSGKETNISRKYSQTPVISIGRENCDFCVNDINRKVSRHHGDIALKEFTGGRFLVYTDCSANGTVINNERLTRGMSVNIPIDNNMPVIYLAGMPECGVSCEELLRLLQVKAKEMEEQNEVNTSEVSDATAKEIAQLNKDIDKQLGKEISKVVTSIESGEKPSGDEDKTADTPTWKFVLCIVFSLIPLIGWIIAYNTRKTNPKLSKICLIIATTMFFVNTILNFIL